MLKYWIDIIPAQTFKNHCQGAHIFSLSQASPLEHGYCSLWGSRLPMSTFCGQPLGFCSPRAGFWPLDNFTTGLMGRGRGVNFMDFFRRRLGQIASSLLDLIPPSNSPTVIHAAIQTGQSCFAHFPPEVCSRLPVLSGGTIEYQS